MSLPTQNIPQVPSQSHPTLLPQMNNLQDIPLQPQLQSVNKNQSINDFQSLQPNVPYIQNTITAVPNQNQNQQIILSQQQNQIQCQNQSTQLLQSQPIIANQQQQIDLNEQRRHRRSKHEQEGRIYTCECGKSYLSQPALNNHKKTKHPELTENCEKRGRGRPRKYLQNPNGDFENNKYESFFSVPHRAKTENDPPLDLKKIIESIFTSLYQGIHSNSLYNKVNSIDENIILKNLLLNLPIDKKEKTKKTCDDVFYEYLVTYKDQINEKTCILVIKFILLFRECFNKNKAENKKDNVTQVICEEEENINEKKVKEWSMEMLPESLPELCNEFYTVFMENNDYFDFNDDEDKNEIIELIQHFCTWLFKNEYTKSKLSLASS